MNPISSRISWKWQKNRHLVEALLLRNAPQFVYKSDPSHLDGEIPVFTFHIALPDLFEQQCLHLADSGYETISSDYFYECLTGMRKETRNKILLTFDDGLKHVWTVAYPLLKKYGLRATCFLIPGCIPENDNRVRPTLEDYWSGNATLEEIMRLDGDDPSLATWEEIKRMHDSGVIDFQSHTMYHSLVFTSNRIFDFINPGYNTHFYGNIHVPLYSCSGKDIFSRDPVPGLPVYFAKPRMSARKRFFDDEGLRNRCIETVKEEGVERFFSKKDWRKRLNGVASDYRNEMNVDESYETPEKRDREIFDELATSKRMIEEKLPGKVVNHLCFPWYEAGDFAVSAAHNAGFKASYFGALRGKSTNRPGDDPMKTVRLEDIFLLRLPGAQRISVMALFNQLVQFRSVPGLLFGS